MTEQTPPSTDSIESLLTRAYARNRELAEQLGQAEAQSQDNLTRALEAEASYDELTARSGTEPMMTMRGLTCPTCRQPWMGEGH